MADRRDRSVTRPAKVFKGVLLTLSSLETRTAQPALQIRPLDEAMRHNFNSPKPGDQKAQMGKGILREDQPVPFASLPIDLSWARRLLHMSRGAMIPIT